MMSFYCKYLVSLSVISCLLLLQSLAILVSEDLLKQHDDVISLFFLGVKFLENIVARRLENIQKYQILSTNIFSIFLLMSNQATSKIKNNIFLKRIL